MQLNLKIRLEYQRQEMITIFVIRIFQFIFYSTKYENK